MAKNISKKNVEKLKAYFRKNGINVKPSRSKNKVAGTRS